MDGTRTPLADTTVTQRGGAADRFAAAADELFGCAYRTAYRILGDSGRSEDVAQEALIRAFARWETVESYAAAWTTRVASNLAIDEWRRHRADPDDSIDITVGDQTAAVEVRDELNRALSQLPPRRRDVIVMRYLCDLSPEDTAVVMNTSVAGVLKHTVRGLADLRRLMGALPDDPIDTTTDTVAHQTETTPVIAQLVSA